MQLPVLHLASFVEAAAIVNSNIVDSLLAQLRNGLEHNQFRGLSTPAKQILHDWQQDPGSMTAENVSLVRRVVEVLNRNGDDQELASSFVRITGQNVATPSPLDLEAGLEGL